MTSTHRMAELVVRLGKEPSVADEIVPMLYDELRALAARHLGGERPNHTLQPTDLANEVYIRLKDAPRIDFRGRARFLALASVQIRRILVDHARRRRAEKRGSGQAVLSLDELGPAAAAAGPDHAEIDRALQDLASRSPRQFRVVEMKFYGGMTIPEIADVLEFSPSTVKNEWMVARAWLRKELFTELADPR